MNIYKFLQETFLNGENNNERKLCGEMSENHFPEENFNLCIFFFAVECQIFLCMWLFF